MNIPAEPDNAGSLFEAHPRDFRTNRYVYPVLSRRAKGISVGVNLNLDKLCNFNCVYCQVDRADPVATQPVELDRLRAELNATLDLVVSGEIYQDSRFCRAPEGLRRLNDVALSGDGEPTTCANFAEVVAACAEVRSRRRLDGMKLVLITNASMLHRDAVRRGLNILDASNGEIWAKLDAGTEDYYRLVTRSAIPFQRILDNLTAAARARPIVIQSLFMTVRGRQPGETEQRAFCGRLNQIVAAGGRVKLVQLCTVARPPAESWVAPLADDQVEAIADLVRQETHLVVETFYR